MSRRCELTGVGPMVGHNVSHSNIKTKRRFLPALSPATLQSDALGQSFKLRVSNAALRTLDFKGGLDAFLVKARDEQLSPRALKIKRQLKAKLAENKAAWQVLERFDKPFITAFSDADPITRGGETVFQGRVPGARGVAHTTLKGGHFVQEDSPAEIAALLDDLVASLVQPEPAE